jgi:hypothetical protein
VSLHDDMADDLTSVFLSDFAHSALLRPESADETGTRVLVSVGIDRMTNDRYVKHQWELRIPAAAGAKQGDQLVTLTAVGTELARYQLSEPVERDQLSIVFGARKV